MLNQKNMKEVIQDMSRYFAIAAAAALLICAAGCNSLETVDIDSENQAYSRVLYNDGEYVPEQEDEEDFYWDYEDEEQQPSEENHAEQPKEEQKTEKKEKKERKEPSGEKEKKPESSASGSSASSGSSSGKYSVYVIPGRKGTSSQKSASSSASSSRTTGSKTHSDTDKASVSEPGQHSSEAVSSAPAAPKEKKGSFSADDLSYDAGVDYIDLGDSEEFVRKLLGAPNNDEPETDSEQQDAPSDTEQSEPSEQPAEPEEPKELQPVKGLIYDNVLITLHLDEASRSYFVYNIIVSNESEYVTRRGVYTDCVVERVIEAYGEPTRITLPDGTVVEPDESAQDDTDVSAPEGEPGKRPDGLYSYIIADRSFSVTIENGYATQMIFRYETAE